jgi:multimeric flavodoxin WrbA
MKIAVLNGSPKGEISVTVQYIKFIEKKFPQHQFRLINIAHDIIKIEKDRKVFDSIIQEVKDADGVIWAFPLYVFLVASQYKRFIEMIRENKSEGAFKGKYTCALSTSIHFFDHTAHNYIRGVCEDLGMKFVESFSADMDDIFIEDRRRILLKWAGDFLAAIERKAPTSIAFAPLVYSKFDYKPGTAGGKVDNAGLKIKVLADIRDEKSNVAGMVKRFAGAFQANIDVIDYRNIDMKGGCLGCIQCGFDNTCVYKDKDQFMEFFKANMLDQDVTIFAGAITDRYFSSRMKMFWDRAFFNGHIPTQIGKQVGFLVSGPLSQLGNMQEIMQAMAEMGEGNFAGVVTDESRDSRQVDALLDDFAGRCVDYSRQKYVRPKTFLGVGGHKIFRDAIWAKLRFPFDADFKFYESHGMFDFPQDNKRYLEYSQQMIQMIQDPKMREMVRKMIKTEMVKNYQKVVETK